MDKKKLWIIASIVVGALLVALIGYLVFNNRSSKDDLAQASVTPSAIASVSTTVLASKTVSKTPTKTVQPEVETPTPTPAKSDQDLIDEALASKFSTDASNITLSISKKSDASAYGSFTIEDQQEGGYFVAVKDGDSWKIIADGNGTIECSILDQYNVPNTVVAECYDSNTQESKVR